MIKVAYVNHKAQQCGVYEFGKQIGSLLKTSEKFDVSYIECDSFDELKKYYKSAKPDVIIYNFHPTTMPWVLPSGRYKAPKTYYLNSLHIGTIHEVYQKLADAANNELFDLHIAPDPTLLLKNPLVYKTGRLLPEKSKAIKTNNPIPIIGSFGFATLNKGFEDIITLVQNEFDEAIINLNIPFAKFGDTNGENAKQTAKNCRQLIIKPNITLNVDHTYLEKNDLIDFLAKNSINVFLYKEAVDRGISSATDWAMASGRPLAISKSSLFRHLYACKPSICVADNSLSTIISNGIAPFENLFDEYSAEVILWEYERILADSINRNIRKKALFDFYKTKLKKALGLSIRKKANNFWTKTDDDLNYAGKKENVGEYQLINIGSNKLNRILDNSARELYQPAISFFFNNFPDLIKKKIPEANVQQAFVLDTTVRLSQQFNDPQILAVGAFEDTAAEGLKLLNYDIDFIDPILNYDIEAFASKPNVKKASYDIIISTSVIEHVEMDEKFVQDIAYLLKRGGYAIITCDYKDQYKKGDNIPKEDFRLYTQQDLRVRLMNVIPDCRLVDEAEWDCEKPDFYYAGIYNYTFATFVFTKT